MIEMPAGTPYAGATIMLALDSTDDVFWLTILQGKYEEAERLFRRSLTITEATLGEGHPHFPAGLNNLAGLLAAQVSLEFLYHLFSDTTVRY